jgi:uncharacterized protein YfaS (alpha-2-macroglobulin family)
MMMSLQEILKGDTLGKVWSFYVDDGTGAQTATDPDTISIKIYDSAGALKTTLAKSDLTRMETGKYKMIYNVPSDAALGLWKILVQANVTAGGLQNTERFSFSVVA